MTTAAPNVLAAIVEVILDECDPDEIVLFGSHAKGTNHRNSDVDLLVIAPFTASPWIRGRDLLDALRRFPIKIDVHLLTRDELDVGARQPHSYLSTLFDRSRCLYRRVGHEEALAVGPSEA
jgi:uncharacterized protein